VNIFLVVFILIYFNNGNTVSLLLKGRAQELLLILDEYWAAHPELHEIPIYYASSLAKKCMAVYQVRSLINYNYLNRLNI
jgi:Cft2 family RNA processing exonuclease